MTTKKYEQINTAGVKVGDYLRVKPARRYTPAGTGMGLGTWADDPGYVESARPGFEKGEPAKVLARRKVEGGSTELDLQLHANGEKVSTRPRAGTAFWYRNTLSSAGEPLPEDTYPVCPTCKAAEDDPSCKTKAGDNTTTHKARQKLIDGGAPPTARTVRVLRKYDDGRVGVVDAVPIKASDLNVGDLVQVFRTQANGGEAYLKEGHVEDVEFRRVKGARRAGAGWLIEFDGTELLGVGVDLTEWNVLERTIGRRAMEGSRMVKAADERPIVAPKPSATRGMGLTAEQERARDAEPDDDEPGPSAREERCPTCKSFGLVRGVGPDAGKHYKTINGALQAEAKGNAKPCPDCEHGAEVAA